MRVIYARIRTIHDKNSYMTVETLRGEAKTLEVPHMDVLLLHLIKIRQMGQFVLMTVEDVRLIGTMGTDTEGNFFGYHHFECYWRDRNEAK